MGTEITSAMSEIGCDIKKLADLLKVEDENSDSEDDLPSVGMSKIGPGDIGKSSAHNVSNNRSANTGDGSNKGATWQTSEVVNQPCGDEYLDPREQPEYDIKYSQSVSPEDVFLQMGGKTALTASCENMVITIHMKGESKNAIDLSITKSALDVRSPLYQLHLPLPHPVDPDNGHAEWDGKEEVLSVRVRMVREYDFINF